MRKKICLPVVFALLLTLLFFFASCQKDAADDGATTTEAGTTETRQEVLTVETEVPSASASETETETETASQTEPTETVPVETDAPTESEPAAQQPEAPSADNNVPSGSFSGADMSISISGVRMSPNSNWASYSSALGEPSGVTQAPSCHFDGMDNIYEYSGFSVYTYRNGGEDYVYNIEITSSSIATDKGIHVGSSEADVLSAYGDSYANRSDSLIEYRSGAQSMYISLSGGTVSMIELYSE